MRLLGFFLHLVAKLFTTRRRRECALCGRKMHGHRKICPRCSEARDSYDD